MNILNFNFLRINYNKHQTRESWEQTRTTYITYPFIRHVIQLIILQEITYIEITNMYKLSQENSGRESLVYDFDKDIDDSIVLENFSWKVLKRKCHVGVKYN